MNKLIYTFAAMALLFCSCSDDKLNDIKPVNTGTVTDDQGNVYNWIQVGDLQWTTSNAMNGTPVYDFEIYDEFEGEMVDAFTSSEKKYMKDEYIPVYGNLMQWEEAVKSAPEGWRLPTDEDWQKLEAAIGMKNTGAVGLRGEKGVGYKLQDPESIALLLGGGMNKEKVYGWFEYELANEGEFGYYWTSTEGPVMNDVEHTGYYRKIFNGNGAVDRRYGFIEKHMSVRWVRDVK